MKQLVLSHTMPELEDEIDAAVDAVRHGFSGEIVVARDLPTVTVDRR